MRMPLVKVSNPVKLRLDAMKQDRIALLGREITYTEIVEILIAEHDRNKQEAAGA